MEWADILKYFEENKDSEDVKKFLAQQEKPITLDRVKAFAAENVEAMQWLQSERDRAVTKGIETWKENTLPGIIEDKTKNMSKKPSPLEQRIADLEKTNEQQRLDLKKADLAKLAADSFTEKKLPTGLASFFVDSDEEKTKTNIGIFDDTFTKAVDAAVTERLKLNPTLPKDGDGGKPPVDTNPWSKKDFNLTEQGRIFKEDPEKAKQMKAAAGAN